MTAFQCCWHPSHVQRQMPPHLVIIRARKLQMGGGGTRLFFFFFFFLLAKGILKIWRVCEGNFAASSRSISPFRAASGIPAAPAHCLFSRALSFALPLLLVPTLHWGCFPRGLFHQLLPVLPALLLISLFLQNHLPCALQTSSKTPSHLQLRPYAPPHLHLPTAKLLPSTFLTPDVCRKITKVHRTDPRRTAFHGNNTERIFLGVIIC